MGQVQHARALTDAHTHRRARAHTHTHWIRGQMTLPFVRGSCFCRGWGGGGEREGEGERKEEVFRLISYEVNQNCEAPCGQNHRLFDLLDEITLKFVQQQLGGQKGQLEGKGGRELVSCSLKLTTLFGAWFGLYAFLPSVVAHRFEETVSILSLWSPQEDVVLFLSCRKLVLY